MSEAGTMKSAAGGSAAEAPASRRPAGSASGHDKGQAFDKGERAPSAESDTVSLKGNEAVISDADVVRVASAGNPARGGLSPDGEHPAEPGLADMAELIAENETLLTRMGMLVPVTEPGHGPGKWLLTLPQAMFLLGLACARTGGDQAVAAGHLLDLEKERRASADHPWIRLLPRHDRAAINKEARRLAMAHEDFYRSNLIRAAIAMIDEPSMASRQVHRSEAGGGAAGGNAGDRRM